MGDGDGIVTGSAGRSSSWSRDKVTSRRLATAKRAAGEVEGIGTGLDASSRCPGRRVVDADAGSIESQACR